MPAIEADAIIQAIAEAAEEGPLFIVVEIDTPGGAVHSFNGHIVSRLKAFDLGSKLDRIGSGVEQGYWTNAIPAIDSKIHPVKYRG